jgi:hypothetical protein
MNEVSAANALRDPPAGEWLHDGSLDEVTEINRQALGLMVAMATSPCYSSPSVLSDASAWCDLPERALEELATSPCLLADAYFDDAARWRQALQPEAVHDGHETKVFIGRDADDFIRRVLLLGWHLARADRQMARMVLGMSPACAQHLGRLRLRDMDWMAQHRASWVRPRWEHQPRVWRNLLASARREPGDELLQFRARGLQLMAATSIPAKAAPSFTTPWHAPRRPAADRIRARA